MTHQPTASTPVPASEPACVRSDGEQYYPASAFANLRLLEEGSFWFRSRNRIILSALQRFVTGASPHYAEVGCGTGFVLAAVERRFPAWSVVGFDIHDEAVEFTQNRAPRARVRRADIHALPEDSAYDAIGVFDVLEHLDDDLAALRALRQVLRARGHVFITVPQHPELWSPYDDAARHRRRYRRAEMRQRLEDAGFEVLFLSSFVSFLLPALWWRRLRLRRLDPATAASATQDDLTPSPWLNWLGSMAMWPDVVAARFGVPIPFGGSLLAVARKP